MNADTDTLVCNYNYVLVPLASSSTLQVPSWALSCCVFLILLSKFLVNYVIEEDLIQYKAAFW